jgi:hypothetical protein
LRRKKYYGGIQELIGYSTFSALWMDVFSAGIPTALPSYLPIHKDLQKYFFPYNHSENLSSILHNYFSKNNQELVDSFQTRSRIFFQKQILKAMETIFA